MKFYILSLILFLLFSVLVIFVIIRISDFVKNREKDSKKIASIEKKLEKLTELLEKDKKI